MSTTTPTAPRLSGWGELPDTVEALENWLAEPADEPESWTERALCKETDPEAFFPEKGGSTREAKRICLGCEVKDDCLDYALAHDERFGIWGGLSERERRKLKKLERDAAAAAEQADQATDDVRDEHPVGVS